MIDTMQRSYIKLNVNGKPWLGLIVDNESEDQEGFVFLELSSRYWCYVRLTREDNKSNQASILIDQRIVKRGFNGNLHHTTEATNQQEKPMRQ